MDEEPYRLPFAHFSNRRLSTAASSFPSETEHVSRGADRSTLGLTAMQDLERGMKRVDSILVDDMSITGQDLLGFIGVCFGATSCVGADTAREYPARVGATLWARPHSREDPKEKLPPVGVAAM